MPPGTCRKKEFPMQQLTVPRWLTHCTQYPKAVLSWAGHTCIGRFATPYCFLSTIMLVRMSNARCHADSQAMASMGLKGLQVLLLLHYQDIVITANNSATQVQRHTMGTKKKQSVTVKAKQTQRSLQNKTEKKTLRMSKQCTFSGETCTEERARLAQA